MGGDCHSQARTVRKGGLLRPVQQPQPPRRAQEAARQPAWGGRALKGVWEYNGLLGRSRGGLGFSLNFFAVWFVFLTAARFAQER